jgi:hypothetical protein
MKAAMISFFVLTAIISAAIAVIASAVPASRPAVSWSWLTIIGLLIFSMLLSAILVVFLTGLQTILA